MLSNAKSSAGACRLVRLNANALSGGRSKQQLIELWEAVRATELSHTLELPTAEAVANQSAWLLLALKGREVLGLLSAERIVPPGSSDVTWLIGKDGVTFKYISWTSSLSCPSLPDLPVLLSK